MGIDALGVIKRHYHSCLNVVDDICTVEWKHEVCKELRAILLEVTGEQKYDPWKLDPFEISELQKTINRVMYENKDRLGND